MKAEAISHRERREWPLVENRGHLLKKDELIERVWRNTFVEEANLAQNVSALRKALDDCAEGRVSLHCCGGGSQPGGRSRIACG
jgi:DNA-binding response OmpR family regulator